MKIPIAVAIADVHRTNQKPVCRVDKDFMDTQDRKLTTVADRAFVLGVPVLIAGDLYDTWKCGHDVVNSTTHLLKNRKVIACYGQHELPSHDIGEKYRSPLTTTLIAQGSPSVYNLSEKKGKSMVFVNIVNWGQKVKEIGVNEKAVKVLLVHKTVYLGDKPFPDAKGNVVKLIEKPQYSHYDIIISGDNHKAFTYRKGKTMWLNCGCLFRTDASEKNYEPVMWEVYWDTEKKRVVVHSVPVSPLKTAYRKAVSSKHLETERTEKEWDSDFAKTIALTKGERPKSFRERVCAEMKNRGSSKEVQKRTKEFLEV